MSVSIVSCYSHLRSRWRAMIMPTRVAALLVFGGAAPCVLAQEAAKPQREELDVTMQVIADPDAKQPDEVVRRIPLPVRKPDAPPDKGKNEQRQSDKNATPGREISENAKDRAKQAAEQREEAQRSVVNERRRNPGPPSPPPRPNPRPPRN